MEVVAREWWRLAHLAAMVLAVFPPLPLLAGLGIGVAAVHGS